MTTYFQLAAKLNLTAKELDTRLADTFAAHEADEFEDPSAVTGDHQLPDGDWAIIDAWVPYLEAIALGKPVIDVALELVDTDGEPLVTISIGLSRTIAETWSDADFDTIDNALIPVLQAYPTTDRIHENITNMIGEPACFWSQTHMVTDTARTNGYTFLTTS